MGIMTDKNSAQGLHYFFSESAQDYPELLAPQADQPLSFLILQDAVGPAGGVFF